MRPLRLCWRLQMEHLHPAAALSMPTAMFMANIDSRSRDEDVVEMVDTDEVEVRLLLVVVRSRSRSWRGGMGIAASMADWDHGDGEVFMCACACELCECRGTTMGATELLGGKVKPLEPAYGDRGEAERGDSSLRRGSERSGARGPAGRAGMV